MLRLCVIGCGFLSSRRIYPYLAPAGAKLVGMCDLDRPKADEKARIYGGTAYSEVEEMLAEQKPDGVIICTGPKGHALLATQVLKLGYPVYTEKPPALTAADALEVARVSKETGLLCTTAFKKRYSHAYTRAQMWAGQFPPDQLLSLSIDYCSAPYTNDDMHNDFLLDFAIHMIDIAPFLFGDVAQVFAFSKGKDAYAVSLKFKNGAVGTLNFNDGRSFTVPTEEVELTAKDGHYMSIHNSSNWKIGVKDQGTEWREPPTFTSGGDSGRDTGHLSEIEDFIAALKEKRTTRSNIYESYKTMVLYEAIRKSADTGETIKPTFAVS
jgi:myo-inositol 2-dehydrogenase/D-chiro-inositol 1-dehydrogenase